MSHQNTINHITATPLTQQEQLFVTSAKEALKKVFVPEKHFVLALMKNKSGAIYQGFNLKATATRASICAENIAIANAIAHNSDPIELIVAVAYAESDGLSEPVIVSPCGLCRELLHDYAPTSHVILPRNGSGKLVKVALQDLLAYAYKRPLPLE